MRIAVIGSGISGLGCAWLLWPQHQVTLFEANGYLGGHTHTHLLDIEGRPTAVDSGFIVYNELHYPLLTGLFAELGVQSQPNRVRGAPEDGRHRALRARWGHGRGQLKWFGLFQFQALLIPLFSIPFAAAAANPATHFVWLAIALGVWNVSVLGESRADHQLAQFRATPANRGKTCRAGLWRYSRHPNYFFEWLHWFSYVALSLGAHSLWICLCGPVLMYVFLRWISGVPYTEAHALRTRGEDYRHYQRTTSVLIPWWPRHA